MRPGARLAILLALSGLCGRSALLAQPLTPAALVPCAFRLDEVAAAFGIQLERNDAADMTIPVGRDVGCLYSLKNSDFVFGVRQTWDSTRTGSASEPTPPGARPILGDPDGASFVEAAGSDSGGMLIYVRGKVKTQVFWHGGSLSSAAGLQYLLKLPHVP